MPYFRAYQLSPNSLRFTEQATQLEEQVDQPVAKSTMINVTPSSNWIQETFRYSDFVVDPERGRSIVIGKANRSSLYQRIINMSDRAKISRLRVTFSDPVPSVETIKKLTEKANGDSARLDYLLKEWEVDTIKRYGEATLDDFITGVSDEEVRLNHEKIFQTNGISSIKVTVLSPELPTRGDLPITAILYSPNPAEELTGIGVGDNADAGTRILDGQATAAVYEKSLPFTWTDRSGFTSTIMILPNVIYPIQPVSIRLDYEITLLA
jgi:hypothetical protein